MLTLPASLQAMLDSSDRQWAIIFGLVFVPATAASFYFLRQKQTNQSRRRGGGGSLRRSVSFTSFGLALGSFPVRSRVPDATINTACYFDADPPSVEAIAVQIVEPLLQYERMSHVLDMETARFRPSSRSYQPKDLVRVLDIDSSDETLTNQTIFAHLQDALNGGDNGDNENEDEERRTRGGDLPWWEILVVRNRGQGPSALVIRVHHALADGLALVHAFRSILKTTTTTTTPNASVAAATDGSSSSLHMSQTTTTTTRQMAADSAGATLCNSDAAVPLLPSAKKQPKKSFLSILWSLIESSIHVLTLGATKYDDDTAFSKCNHSKMNHNGKRDFIMFPAIPLAFIKELKSAANCTVNDIVTTAISQAIHDYCTSQQDPILAAKGAAIQCRALLPVGFPRNATELSEPVTAMRNKWCMVSCDIGMGCDDIMDRLATVRTNTTEMKDKQRAPVQLAIQNTIPPLLPKSVARQAVMDVFSRHSLVLTNVPGPDQTCVLAGKTVTGVQLFFNNILTQVDIVSYAGQVFGNIVYDPEALPEFQDFGRHYARALLLLAERLQVKPPVDLVRSLV